MYESLFKSPMQRVFLYGTLKRGEPNHKLITNVENGYAKFLGLGKTISKYPLVIATRYNIPFTLKRPGIGNQIIGEVYDVDSQMLKKLDDLEEHPNFYVRTEDNVLLAPESEIKRGESFESIGDATKVWIYILANFRESLMELPMYSSYSSEGSHGLKYQERYLRDPSYNHREEVTSSNNCSA
ncbi:PREDICTED: putative gamma-glutamylcyclotransferase CG2811 [Ceratosolen solmsi marchali]|uniref:Gamma-glutamylcyclotransferase family protein n=1 Tax=Ceratosolen solmsi marchali TaxID=326594 RepID=A0AAJ7DTZ8_9HYME|nr:PREDICTED: putative gamma-glutamylcyclotransferase CG2811 [Ceratosolen solmsi marchali]